MSGIQKGQPLTQQHELAPLGASNLEKGKEQKMYSDEALTQAQEILEVEESECLPCPHPGVVKFLSYLHFSIHHLKKEI